jgi:hypothetical protein
MTQYLPCDQDIPVRHRRPAQQDHSLLIQAVKLLNKGYRNFIIDNRQHYPQTEPMVGNSQYPNKQQEMPEDFNL